MSFVAGEARTLLSRTPALLDAWLRGLDSSWLDCDEGPETWTPRQVLGHLIHGEKTDWIPRLHHLLEHGTAVPFEAFDMAAHLAGPPPTVGDLLDELARLRSRNLRALDAALASGTSLNSRGLHPELGEVTLQQMLAAWVAHDLDHVVQIARTMARRYAPDVGPWAQYLRVMAAASPSDER